MMASCHGIVRWTKVASVALLAAIGLTGSASAGVASISASFGQYSGAVGNGVNEQSFGRLEYMSLMNGYPIGPIEAIPGLESFFTPADPNDPNALGQGIGRGVVDLLGASSVSFYTSVYDPDDESTIYGIDNLIDFTPGPNVNVEVGDEFLLGTFTLQNGEWWAADAIHRFTLEIVTDSSDSALDGQIFSDTVVLHITPNGGPPENRADFFYFEGRPDLGSMRVFESFDGANFGTVELYGKIGSLIPTHFLNPTGGIFLDPSTDPLPFPGVPEPGTLLLLACGLVALIRERPASLRTVATPLSK